MPRKKVVKAKEPIRIRFKELANGNKSIYLDTYKDGKRAYEFLKLYIVPDSTPDAAKINQAALDSANAIKAQKIIELANDSAGINKAKNRSKMLLADWMSAYRDLKAKNGQSKSLSVIVEQSAKYLIQYRGDKVKMEDVDKEFCIGFIDFLHDKAKTKNDKPLSQSSKAVYFSMFSLALNRAVEDDIINFNPIKNINRDFKKRVRREDKERSFFSAEEINKLILTPCGNEQVKRAFLFSCFCGLRISDIYALKWSNLAKVDQHIELNIIMRKTNKALHMPLSDAALRWLPEKESGSDVVFHLPTIMAVERDLQVWAKHCGITKKISFHSGRHTFATSLLTAGADISAISDLLGHRNIAVTQIYAKLVDAKKSETVNLLNGILDNKDNTNN